MGRRDAAANRWAKPVQKPEKTAASPRNDVSIAAKLVGFDWIASVLLWVNLAAYGVSSALFLVRFALYFPRVLADLRDHGRGAGFFTIVAGSSVLGTELVVVAGRAEPARWLWWIAIGFWVVVMYSFFTAVVVREQKPSLEAGINGAWLIATVGTQGVSSLGSLLAPHMAEPEPVLLFTRAMLHSWRQTLWRGASGAAQTLPVVETRG